MLKEGVSIIVCCYNSASRIANTLSYLSELIINDISCEIILVDNASTDNTKEIARTTWSQNPNNKINFKIIDEPVPGVAHARIQGVAGAVYEFSVFCDDDNWLDKNYIQNVFKLFKATPSAGILSGEGLARFDAPDLKPLWFDVFSDGYAVGSKKVEECFVNGVYGAGMAVRTALLQRVLSNREMFLHGRKQHTLSAGEDSEICFRIRLRGYKILYSSVLTYYHYLPANRLTWQYLKRLHLGFARSFVVINLYELALNSDQRQLSAFYWVKKAFYYLGIYLKYWPTHYLAYRNSEGTIEEIRHITWRIIALTYLKYNFKTMGIYRNIMRDKSNNAQVG